MPDQLPRVTYSNLAIDLARVHAKFDAELPLFQSALGQEHGAVIGGDDNVRATQWIETRSPLDQRVVIGRFPRASDAQIDAAVMAAKAAFVGWSGISWEKRVTLVRAFSEVLSRRRYALAQAALFEVGKSRIEAIGEAEEAVDLPAYYADEIERHNGYRQALRQVRPGESTESRLMPMGVFAVVAPFNFPVALSVNMITGAMLAGNTVVFKPAPDCGLTGRMIVEAALEAGIPSGVLNLVYGDGAVGQRLTAHPGVAGIAFTGSHAVGMALARSAIAGGWAKPVIAEMGGKNPAYVTANADLAVAAEGVARSAFGLQGQKCSACSVVYVDNTVAGEFVARLIAFTDALTLGDPRMQETFVGAVQNAGTISRFDAAVMRTHDKGVVLRGGRRRREGDLAHGFFLEPTIVQLDRSDELTRDELFMPFLVVRPVASLATALAEGNAVPYGLAAGIYSQDRDEVDQFLASAEAGVLYANRASGATTGAWPGVQSFCGWKGSGVSHKGGLGPYFLPQFMREQSRTLIL